MRIALVAIFKNECEYVLEWIAYHRAVLGISDFIIADNVSDDGTSQLLEALDLSGDIKRVFFPRESENIGPQVPAYNFILNKFAADYDFFLFIDADEFLVNNTGKAIADVVQQYSAINNFGAVALNWRIFGSSGNTYKQDGLVIERFYRASKNHETINSHLKSLVAGNRVQKMHIHQADLNDGFIYYDENLQPTQFVNHPSDSEVCIGTKTAPYTKAINNSRLYVAHFAVKSKSEHFQKKASRGSAGGSAGKEKGRQYFIGHDMNYEPCLDLYKHRDEVLAEIILLKKSLREKSPYFNYSQAAIDNKRTQLSGWAITDSDQPLTLTCLLDEKREKELTLNTKRKDLVKMGLSETELCGFSYPWAEIGDFTQSIKVWIKGGNLVIFEMTVS